MDSLLLDELLQPQSQNIARLWLGRSGYVDDPRKRNLTHTTSASGTPITAVGDAFGRVIPIAGGIDMIQSVSASRLQEAQMPKGGRKNAFERTREPANAYWTKTNVTATDNNVADPDGNNAAGTLLETAATAEHYMRRVVSVAASSNNAYWVWVSSIGGRNARIRILDVATATNGFLSQFNLSTGAVTSSSNIGAGVGQALTVIAEDSGYWIGVQGVASTATSVYFDLYATDGTTVSYLGDITKGIAVYDMQLNYNTTTRLARQRVGGAWDCTEAGVPSWYGHYADGTDAWYGPDSYSYPTDQLLYYPRQVNSSHWTKTNCTALDGQTSWDNSATATRLTANTSSNSGVSQAYDGAAGEPVTLSLKVKKGTAGWLRIFLPVATNGNAWFDLTNRIPGTIQANITDYGMTDAGNGYDLVYITGVTTGAGNAGIRIEDTNGVTGSPTAGETLFVADPMFNLGTEPLPFVDRSSGFEANGFYAAAEQYWSIVDLYCGFDTDGTLSSQCGSTLGNRMYQAYVSSGTLGAYLRGTANVTAQAWNNGIPNLCITTCDNGTVYRSINGGARVALVVGAAAAEVEKISFFARTPSSPSNFLQGVKRNWYIDRAYSVAEEQQIYNYFKNTVGTP